MPKYTDRVITTDLNGSRWILMHQMRKGKFNLHDQVRDMVAEMATIDKRAKWYILDILTRDLKQWDARALHDAYTHSNETGGMTQAIHLFQFLNVQMTPLDMACVTYLFHVRPFHFFNTYSDRDWNGKMPQLRALYHNPIVEYNHATGDTHAISQQAPGF